MSKGVGDFAGDRRRRATFQVLARLLGGEWSALQHRGGQIAWVEEDGRLGLGGHPLGAEGSVSRRLTDRLSIRFGASAVVPFSVNPTVLLA